MKQPAELYIELNDNEWPFMGTDHDRTIVRAIVVDDEGFFYFVRAVRNDDFGEATLIETSGAESNRAKISTRLSSVSSGRNLAQRLKLCAGSGS